MPGVSVVGIVGAGAMIVGVVFAFTTYGPIFGALALMGALAGSAVAITIALKSNTWKRAMLDAKISGKVNVIDVKKIQTGDQGVTVTRLNPMGKALINEEFYEVASTDNLINENTKIKVVKIDGNKIYVKPKL